MTQIFGSALQHPWALVKFGDNGIAGRRPCSTVAYITDDEGDFYWCGLVEFYRKLSSSCAVRDDTGKVIRYETVRPGDSRACWHFRFRRPKKILKSDVLYVFPNGKSRDQGPTPQQIAAAKKLIPKLESVE